MANGTIFLSKEYKQKMGMKVGDLCESLEKQAAMDLGFPCAIKIASSDLGGKEIGINIYDVGNISPTKADTFMCGLADEAIHFSWSHGVSVDLEEVSISVAAMLVH